MTPPAASAAAPAIHPRRTTGPRRAPATTPRRPRRVSGPAKPARDRSRNPARGQTRGWAGPARAVGLAEAVATHRLLDRLIRGRLWIGVIAFALIGIVTMQLVLLKLNAGIGRSLVRETLLQRENATLSAENSEVAAGEQVEAQAEHAGMELIPAGALRFLTAHPSTDVSKAAAALSAPIAAASSTGGEATASNPSATGEASDTATTGEPAAQSTSPGEAAATSTTTGAASTRAPAGTETAATQAPAASTETPAAGASTATGATGASEATSQSTPAAGAPAPSAPTSTGGGTTPGG
jgi:hypothetical protein